MSQADLRWALVLCGAIGLYDVLFVASAVSGIGKIGYKLDVLFPDFLVFHAAARAYFENKLAIVYDTNALTHLQNQLYADRLPYELGFRPFLYPPIWLLIVLPVGLLPLGSAVAAFLAVTAGLAALALRRTGLGWPAIALVLTSPAAVWVVIGGQNTFLSVALMYAGFALLDRRPVLAGILLGLLAYKPQIWLLVPFALLCARAWRALAALAATVLVLVVVTTLIFGADFWLAFVQAAQRAASGAAAAEMYDRVRAHMTTLLAAGKMLGLTTGQAMALQVAGAVLAVAAVGWAFFRHGSSHERTAILVAGTMLISPYTLNYDLLLLMPAAALLFLQPAPGGYVAGERVACLSVWLIPWLCLEFNAAGVPVTPLVILGFAAVAALRLVSTAKVELPAAASAR